MSAAFERLAAGAIARRRSFGLKERRAALEALRAAIGAHESAILAALKADLGKPEAETRLTEILPIQSEISHTLRHLRGWMRVRRVRPTLAMLGTRARIRPEPKGTALIIAPWNYPLSLALGPLVSALAAGCAAVIKPSELAPATAGVVARIVADLPADLVAVEQGGVETASALLALPFDHIFFTGSPEVGRVVMAAAAKTLASVTLELGGKSPVVIGPGADLARAARMIAWGKFANAGQTCIAPDHVFVPRAQEGALIAALRAEITRMYGAEPKASGSFARIINARHFARLAGLVDEARLKGAEVAVGGTADAQARYLAPTILTRTSAEMGVEQTELFGPILPVIGYDRLEEVLERINAGPKPLALYVFEKERTFIERVCAETSSGAVGINVTLAHYLHLNLPFGGIGNSGLGAAHGIWGFRAFSHEKPVLENRFAPLGNFMPPYSGGKLKLIRAMAKLLGRIG
ncbi:aldehyde dehydrogenase [Rhodobacter xanthinilyticus]|uniref:Aldehyde dehydrogenase n=1 Tax=Rhodobacter xanthinilyticus TaxID=1850250 RepID=A0A1D9MBR7_9RHOB|nr:aldehyde dehydrogenase family protein [Rhodobacter xanthinilyticus]AOZ69240.1 aldehyde dehydrogenase [Rhodobacter xanthinilyticus]